MRPVDNLLNNFTIYKVVLYALIILSFIPFLLSALQLLPFSAIQLAISFMLIFISCYASNVLFSKVFRAYTNSESYFISALILFLIIQPPLLVFSINEYLPIVAACVLAMGSKFFLAFRKRHIFNPVAISLVTLGVFGYGIGTWWIATPYMFLPVLVMGFLIIRKIRKIQMFLSFLIPATLVMVAFGLTQYNSLIGVLQQSFLSWPTIFFGTVMLTEPLTTPPRKFEQLTYGAFVGFVFGTQYNLGPFYSTPELALVLGNLYSYTVSLKEKVYVTLLEKRQIAKDTYEFVFKSPLKIPFLAGQYLEWTLPHKKVDLRGVRRYFTIASSPTEENVRLGVRFNTPSSSFKKALLQMKEGEKIFAGNLYGDFVLKQAGEKLVFIAGGIGVTPFVSMIQFLLDTNTKEDIYLFYSCKFMEDVAYKELFEKASAVGVKTICVITDENENVPQSNELIHGRLNPEIISRHIPDFKDRLYYLSGPNAMVEGYKKMLKELKIPHSKIKTDYFPGF